MSKRKRILVAIGLLLLIFGGIFAIKFIQLQGFIAMMSKPQPPATVASIDVTSEQWRPTLQAVGTLVAVNGIELSSEVEGIVSEIMFQSGQLVEKGAPLVKLDDEIDRAALEALRAQSRLAKVQYNRSKNLLPKKAVSQSKFDTDKATYEAALANATQQAAIVARKTIRAPFTGLLGIRKADIGDYLKAGAPIVRLESLDPLYVDYSLPERHLHRLAVGQEVHIQVDAFPGETFTGEVSALDSGIDEGTRSIMVRATISNSDGRLRPGMFAEVSTLQTEKLDVLTVPRTAVSFNTYGDFVYVIQKDDEQQLTAKRRRITTGETREGRIVVTSGLENGETVVRAGLVKLRDGQSVQINNSVELKDAEVTKE